MVESPVIHVVIPTGGREETIWSTLNSCVSQSYQNLVIWVCDNSFKPQTEHIVNAIGDKRIRLIKPNARLCMSENWEFALSHIEDGYCTIIGDDDSLMPESIAYVAKLIRSNPEIKVINHLPASYYWPNYIEQDRANTLEIRPINFGKCIQEVRPILSDVCAFKIWYGFLPVLYHGFVSINHISNIKLQSSLPFFNFCAPDIYAAIVLAMHTDRFLMVSTPLTVGGQSARSNGANYLNQTNLGKQFTDELPPSLHFRYQSMSIYLAVYEALENAFQAYPESAKNYKIDKEQLLQAVISESLQMSPDQKEQVKQMLHLIYEEDIVNNTFEKIITAENDQLSSPESPPRLAYLFMKNMRRLKLLMAKGLIHVGVDAVANAHQDGFTANRQPAGDFYMADGWLMLNSPMHLNPYGIDCVHSASQFLRDKIDSFKDYCE